MIFKYVGPIFTKMYKMAIVEIIRGILLSIKGMISDPEWKQESAKIHPPVSAPINRRVKASISLGFSSLVGLEELLLVGAEVKKYTIRAL